MITGRFNDWEIRIVLKLFRHQGPVYRKTEHSAIGSDLLLEIFGVFRSLEIIEVNALSATLSNHPFDNLLKRSVDYTFGNQIRFLQVNIGLEIPPVDLKKISNLNETSILAN